MDKDKIILEILKYALKHLDSEQDESIKREFVGKELIEILTVCEDN